MTPSMCRLLALDIRATRVGYAAFEVPQKLLGFGISRMNPRGERLAAVIKRFRPSTIVVRELSAGRNKRRYHALALKSVVARAQSLSIPVAAVSEASLKHFLRQLKARNKYEMAAIFASWFPDLRWKVPTTRKCYQPEPWTMQIFDAIAVAVVYLANEHKFGTDNQIL